MRGGGASLLAAATVSKLQHHISAAISLLLCLLLPALFCLSEPWRRGSGNEQCKVYCSPCTPYMVAFESGLLQHIMTEVLGVLPPDVLYLPGQRTTDSGQRTTECRMVCQVNAKRRTRTYVIKQNLLLHTRTVLRSHNDAG